MHLRTIAFLTFALIAFSSNVASAQDKVPPEPLVPGNSLITATPEEGRALAITLSRHSIHAMQNDIPTLKNGRQKYASDALGLIAASQVVAVEFSTIAAANNYWRK